MYLHTALYTTSPTLHQRSLNSRRNRLILHRHPRTLSSNRTPSTSSSHGRVYFSMEFLDALEDMASASISQASNQHRSADIDRWTRLFNLTHTEAQEAMDSHFSNLLRIQITEMQWCISRDTLGTCEHDKESDSYFLSRCSQFSTKPSTINRPLSTPGPRHTKRKNRIHLQTNPFV